MFDRAARARLQRRAAHFLAPMVLTPILGAWFMWVIPDDSQSWLMGGSIAMTMFLGMAAGASVLIAGYAIIGFLRQRLYIDGATATVLVALAFAATAAGGLWLFLAFAAVAVFLVTWCFTMTARALRAGSA